MELVWGIEVTAEKYIVHLPFVEEGAYILFILGSVIVLLLIGWVIERVA